MFQLPNLRFFGLALALGVMLLTSSGATAYAAPARAVAQQEVVNINKATVDELQAVRGIGPALAERIVVYREENGTFESANDLIHVRGIGQAKLAKIKSQISL